MSDVAAGIRHAGREGWCDPSRVAVMGGSAGGYTVLLLCVRHGDLIAAGVSLFGVADLLQLAATTHRFESRYLDSLIGELPRHARRYRERSPLTYASSISVPLLVLQGRDDKVVPLDQADAMVTAIRSAGGEVEYHVYDGEGHGFRRLTNVVDEYERTEHFLARHVLGARREVREAVMEVEYDTPKRGAPKADRAVLLAPGAGADMHAANLVAFASALAISGVPVLRFNFAYKTAGRSSPPKAERLQDELRDRVPSWRAARSCHSNAS